MFPFRSIHSFNPDDLKYLERACQAAWHIEQQEPDRDRGLDAARQEALRRSVFRIAGCSFTAPMSRAAAWPAGNARCTQRHCDLAYPRYDVLGRELGGVRRSSK